MTLTDLLSDLESKARAATPGPWRFDEDSETECIAPEICFPIVDTRLPHKRAEQRYQANAAFIAATHPAVVLALVEVARAAQQAYSADAVAEWFDEEGDGLRAALSALATHLEERK